MMSDGNKLITISNTIVTILSCNLDDCDLRILALMLENIAEQIRCTIKANELFDKCDQSKTGTIEDITKYECGADCQNSKK